MSTTLRCTQLPVRAQEGVREETGTRRDGVQSLQRYRVGWRPREGNNHADGFAKLKAGKTPVLDPGCDDTWGVSPWAQLSLSLSLSHASWRPSLRRHILHTHILGPGVRVLREAARGVHDERAVLLQHAEDAEDPGPPFSHSTTGAVAWSGEDDVASQ